MLSRTKGKDRKNCCFLLKSFLKDISLGKYSTVLFFKNTTLQSSIIGGVLTLITAIIFLSYSVIIFGPIIRMDNTNLDISARPLIGYEYDDNKDVLTTKNN